MSSAPAAPALSQAEAEAQARQQNAADLWDRLWSKAESRDWRAEALSRLYQRVIDYLPENVRVVDFGGGVGAFAQRLQDAYPDARALVVDHSPAAIAQATAAGLAALEADLTDPTQLHLLRGQIGVSAAVTDGETWGISTETLEHFPREDRRRLVAFLAESFPDGVLITVPDNVLGPEEEPQHAVKFTAQTLRAELLEHFDAVRVEVVGFYLLAACGKPAAQGPRVINAGGPRVPWGRYGGPAKDRETVSLCLPVRDEAHDLKAVLASFRGFVDEVVVGIDPRTKDATREVAEAYADVVFDLEDPACQDPANPLHDAAVPPEGVHFSWIRNQCIERCSGEWVFMTEGHERLWAGGDLLLRLGQLIPRELPDGMPLEVCKVTRRMRGSRWTFPWLHRNRPHLRYQRSTHNELTIPKTSGIVQLLPVQTFHDRHHDNATARAVQRRAQNRETLWEDWKVNGNPASLFYFANELHADDPAASAERFEQFLAETQTSGQMRYQARLLCARLYAIDIAGRLRADARALVEEGAELAWCARCSSVRPVSELRDDDETERPRCPECNRPWDRVAPDAKQVAAEVEHISELVQRSYSNAERVLHGCTADDPRRTEHWMWLGDIAFSRDQLEVAHQFWSYAGTHAGRVPVTVWWIEEAAYTWQPAQRLAMVCSRLLRLNEALVWAEKAAAYLPAWAPPEAFAEATRNIGIIREALGLPPLEGEEESDDA